MFKAGGEGELRKWVRRATEDKARWVEYARGGTIGHSDMWVPVRGGIVFAELKIGVIFGDRFLFTVRPDQKGFMRALADDGLAGGFIIGIAGTEEVAFLAGTEANCGGEIEAAALIRQDGVMVVEQCKPDLIWPGLNFIFSRRSGTFDRRNGLE